MGTLLTAKCYCGYENNKIYFGAGMEEEGECYVPALRNGSSKIEMVNIRKVINHFEYTFYTNEIFFKYELVEFYADCEYRLMKKNNLCPKCKEYSMFFIYRGEYD